MQIQINTSNFDHSDALDAHVRETLERTVGRFGERVTRYEVHLSDLNGQAKAGPDDKRCLIEARPAGRDPLVVEDRAGDFYDAITTAAEKMRTSLERRLERT
ncbi:unnamed protein product [Symbiodinium necroappetens]|uniref:Ribosomal subunit interface protein n=1 Tax=Symbiodinium necroappetens TaxID=1628268 RepID=A0A812KP26_9DINO|nr:unnamed protein product [Symbiodinium necroappetens]